MPLSPQQELELLRLRKKKALMSQPSPEMPPVDQSPTSGYSPENPAPGAVPSAPFYSYDEQGNEIAIPWYEQSVAPPTPPVNKPALIGQSLGKAGAMVLGTPGDILQLGSDAVTGGLNMMLPEEYELEPSNLVKPLTSDSIADSFASIAEQFGYPVVDPESLKGSDKTLYNVLSFGGAAGAGGAGLSRLAKSIGGRGTRDLAARPRGGISEPSGFKERTLAPYVEHPVKQPVYDTIAGTGAGYGYDIASSSEMLKDSPLAQIVATFLGAGGASVGAKMGEGIMSVPYDAVRATMFKDILPDGTTAKPGTVEDAARYMQDIATDPAVASQRIAETTRMADREGITRLPSGLASDDVGLTALEGDLRTSNQLPYLERDQMVRTDVSNKIKTLRDPDADVKLPQKVAKQEAERQISEAENIAIGKEQQLREAQGKKIPLVDELGTEPTEYQNVLRGKASKEFDEQYELAKTEREGKTAAKYKEVEKGQTLDITPIKESVDTINKEINKLGFGQTGIPREFEVKIGEIAEEAGGVVNAEDASYLRSEINNAINKAKRAGNTTLATNLQKLKSEVTSTLREQIPGIKEADEIFAKEVAPFFRSGVGGQVNKLKRGATDAEPYKTSETIEYFLDGSPETAKDLKNIIDIAPDKGKAAGALERYLTADFSYKLGADPSPRSVAKWIENNSNTFKEFPELEIKFKTLQKKIGSKSIQEDDLQKQINELSKEFRKAEKNVRITENRINKGVLGSLINDDPDMYVKSIMSGKNRLQKLDEVNILIGKNERAKAGFKRAVTDYMIDEITTLNDSLVDASARDVGQISVAGITKLIKKNEDALAKVYNPEEMNVLKRMRELLSKSGGLARKGTPGSDTASRQAREDLMLALEGGLRLKYGLLKGGGIMGTFRKIVKRLTGDQNESEKLVARAMLDPEIAKHLLDTPIKNEVTWNKKLSTLLSAAHGRSTEEEPLTDE